MLVEEDAILEREDEVLGVHMEHESWADAVKGKPEQARHTEGVSGDYQNNARYHMYSSMSCGHRQEEKRNVGFSLRHFAWTQPVLLSSIRRVFSPPWSPFLCLLHLFYNLPWPYCSDRGIASPFCDSIRKHNNYQSLVPARIALVRHPHSCRHHTYRQHTHHRSNHPVEAIPCLHPIRSRFEVRG